MLVAVGGYLLERGVVPVDAGIEDTNDDVFTARLDTGEANIGAWTAVDE